MLAGEKSVGTSASVMVTVNEHVAVWPQLLFAVQLTMVVPFEKIEPGAGEQVAVAGPESPFAVAAKLTRAEHWRASARATISAGQETREVGAAVFRKTERWPPQICPINNPNEASLFK